MNDDDYEYFVAIGKNRAVQFVARGDAEMLLWDGYDDFFENVYHGAFSDALDTSRADPYESLDISVAVSDGVHAGWMEAVISR